MENIIIHFGGWFRRLVIENLKTGIKKEFSYTEDLSLINEYCKELL